MEGKSSKVKAKFHNGSLKPKVALKAKLKSVCCSKWQPEQCFEPDAGVHCIRQNSGFRLCTDVPETVQHKITGCKMQVGKTYA